MEEIAEIHATEVAPVLWANALAPAGEWAGFDLDWLASEILRRARGHRWLFRGWRKLGLFDRFIHSTTDHHWRKVIELMPSAPRP